MVDIVSRGAAASANPSSDEPAPGGDNPGSKGLGWSKTDS